MAMTDAGLPNGGRTTNFHFQYDDTLPADRGLDLAAELMRHCEADHALVSGWFGKISLWVTAEVRLQDAGGSAGSIGPTWIDLNASFGTTPVDGASTSTFFRHWLVVGVASALAYRHGLPTGQWRAPFDLGSKGTGLVRLVGVEFLRTLGIREVPTLRGMFGTASQEWLNVQEPRPDHVTVDLDHIAVDEVTGCATLFLFFLRDQRGFTVPEIIAAGASTLADVFAKLTGEPRTEGWTSFRDLVDVHYPGADGPYFPPEETVFPVTELDGLGAPQVVTWVPQGPTPSAIVRLRDPAPVDLTVRLSSSVPGAIAFAALTCRIPRGARSAVVPLRVASHALPFPGQDVILTASYAGNDVVANVRVVSPADFPMPSLRIVATERQEPCQLVHVEGSTEVFVVENQAIFTNPAGLTFSWKVTGAAPLATGQATLTIPTLPPAGTRVVIEVSITNAYGVHAEGRLEFTTARAAPTPEDLLRLVKCKLGRIMDVNLHLPPWVPIEVLPGGWDRAHLAVLARESAQVLAQVEKLAAAVGELGAGRKGS